VPLSAHVRGRKHILARGWLAVAPLILDGDLMGVLYNDAALSGSAVDATKQTHLAIYCSHLAQLTRRMAAPKSTLQPINPPKTSPHFHRVRSTLEAETCLSGSEIAQRLSMSPGHLAQMFKLPMGQSLVEYRNQLRLERFFKFRQNPADSLGNGLESRFWLLRPVSSRSPQGDRSQPAQDSRQSC